jgi:hypothetical protein
MPYCRLVSTDRDKLEYDGLLDRIPCQSQENIIGGEDELLEHCSNIGRRGLKFTKVCWVIKRKEENKMGTVYKVIELVGTSTESWEKAAAMAVEEAGKSLRDLRIAEITELDMSLEEGKVVAYRAKVKVSFKYQRED